MTYSQFCNVIGRIGRDSELVPGVARTYQLVDWVGETGKIKMVYDRLRGIERENLPLSRQQTFKDQESVAQENILSSVDSKTPKEYQIGK